MSVESDVLEMTQETLFSQRPFTLKTSIAASQRSQVAQEPSGGGGGRRSQKEGPAVTDVSIFFPPLLDIERDPYACQANFLPLNHTSSSHFLPLRICP